MEITAESLKGMSIKDIAYVIVNNWTKLSPYAKPYLEAMFSLESINDDYYADSGYSVIAYFIANASGWRGPVAKLVRDELKARMKAYEKKLNRNTR